MASIEDQLEADLFSLGQQELELEQKIRELRVTAKEAVQEGRLDYADDVCSWIERLSSSLKALEPQIMNLQRRLYGLRSGRRK